MLRLLLWFVQVAVLIYGLILLADAIWDPPTNTYVLTTNLETRPPVVLSETPARPWSQPHPWRWLEGAPPWFYYEFRVPPWRGWQERELWGRGPSSHYWTGVTRVSIPWAIARLVCTAGGTWVVLWLLQRYRRRLPLIDNLVLGLLHRRA